MNKLLSPPGVMKLATDNMVKPIQLADLLLKKNELIESNYYVAHMVEALPAAKALADKYGGEVVLDQVEVPELFHRNHRFFSGEMTYLDYWSKYYSKGAIKPDIKTITVGKALAKHLIEQYKLNNCTVIENFPEKTVINNPVNLKEKLGLSEEKILMLYPNNIYPSFEFDRVVSWMTQLPVNFHLVSIGFIPKALEDKIKKIINKKQLHKRVHIWGFVDYFEYQNYAQGADFAIIARNDKVLNNRVALPNRIFDVIRSQVPVLSYDAPDIEEIIRKYDIGDTYNHDENDSEIIKKITKLAENCRNYKLNLIKAFDDLIWDNQEVKIRQIFSDNSEVTFIGFRNLYKNQRTLRIAKTLVNNGSKVNIAAIGETLDAPCIKGIRYITF